MRKKSRTLKLLVFGISVFLTQWMYTISNSFAGGDPATLQMQAVKRIDGFIDNFQKTGDHESLGFELKRAEKELLYSYDFFMANKDNKQAALSLIKLGQVHRMQGHWLAASDYCRKAEKLLKEECEKDQKAQELVAEALIGLARTELYGFQGYESAERNTRRAIEIIENQKEKKITLMPLMCFLKYKPLGGIWTMHSKALKKP